MAEELAPLLHRRTDLSTFLIHLTRETDAPARTNLLSILADRNIEARTSYGMARRWAKIDPAVDATQKCVCFTEAPLEQAWMITKDIVGRANALSPYGLIFTKAFGRRRGANPVWYLDITPGRTWLTNPINVLIEVSRRGESYRIDSQPPDMSGALIKAPPPRLDPILKLTPFIEQMGPTTQGTKKEFWWEREWRHVGDFAAWNWRSVVAVLAPAAEHKSLVTDLAAKSRQATAWVEERLRFLDPEWGLERMLAELAGVDEQDAGPLPSY